MLMSDVKAWESRKLTGKNDHADNFTMLTMTKQSFYLFNMRAKSIRQ